MVLAMRKLWRSLVFAVRKRQRAVPINVGLLILCLLLATNLLRKLARRAPGTPAPELDDELALRGGGVQISANASATVPHVIPQYHIRFSDEENIPVSGEDLKNLQPVHKCFMLGHDPALKELPQGYLERNSRGFCLVGPVCFSSENYNSVIDCSADAPSSSCEVFYASGDKSAQLSEALSAQCDDYRERVVESKFSRWARSSVSECSDRSSEKYGVDWHDSGVVVPIYKYIDNIYHFNRMLTFAMHVVWNFDIYGFEKPAAAHFRTKQLFGGPWLSGLSKVFGLKIAQLFSLRQHRKRRQCFKQAVVLGQEGRFDSMPFFNDSEILSDDEIDGDSHKPFVPMDALRYRAAVYEAIGLPPVSEDPIGSPTFRVKAPPWKLVLADRNSSSKRRFEKSARPKMLNMMQSIAKELGMKFEMYSFEKRSFEEQVAMMRDVGIVVGIHGANLQNAMFMQPCSALVEIYPYKYKRFYYAAGGNSGLRYSFHEARTGEEKDCSGIPPERALECGLLYRTETVYITDPEVRLIEGLIRRAAAYLRGANYGAEYLQLVRKGQGYFCPQAA